MISTTSLTVPPTALRMPRHFGERHLGDGGAALAADRLVPRRVRGPAQGGGMAISSARPRSVIWRICERGSSRFCCHSPNAWRSRFH